MKRLLGSLAFILLAGHAYAQDVDFGAFGDAGTLLSPSAPSAPARGAAPAAGRGAAPVVPPPDRLVRLRDALVKAEAPMTKDQEAALNKLLDAEIPAMRRTLQTHGQQMMAARDPNAAGTGAAPSPGGAPPALPGKFHQLLPGKFHQLLPGKFHPLLQDKLNLQLPRRLRQPLPHEAALLEHRPILRYWPHWPRVEHRPVLEFRLKCWMLWK
jgi:hypothetical protein